MRKISLLLVLLFLVCLNGCGENSTAYRVTITGLWNVIFSSPDMPSAGFSGTLDFIQSNTDLSGTMTFSPEEGITVNGGISGTIVNATITTNFTASDGFTLIMGGRATEERLSGSFTLKYPFTISGGPTFTGTFFAEKN